MNRYWKIGLPIALIHLATFLLTFVTVQTSEEAQIQLLYVPFLIADFPISLLHYTPLSDFDSYLKSQGHTWLAYAVYPPLVINGLLGTIWWYFMPKLLLPKRLGGIWASRHANG